MHGQAGDVALSSAAAVEVAVFAGGVGGAVFHAHFVVLVVDVTGDAENLMMAMRVVEVEVEVEVEVVVVVVMIMHMQNTCPLHSSASGSDTNT